MSASSSSSSKPSLVQRQLDKGLALAKDDVKAVSTLGAEAVKSTAYLYPIHGIVYLANHPKLAKSLTPLLMRSVGLSAITLIIMMLWTYLPQVAVLAVVSGPLAFVAALPLVLAESYFIITFLHRTLISPQINERIFDAVLLERGYADLVERGRAVKRGRGGVELGKSLLRPVTGKFSVEGLARYLITLPLNLVPGVGTGVFLLANGLKAGPAAHARYFQLKQLDTSARKSFVEQRRGAYTAFGATALALGLIPVFGTLSTFTSAAGAALWAAELEKEERRARGVPAGGEGKGEEVVGVGEE
ncbi:hypothetical protein JCM21900_003385 [Sporobolomyces salmonicolor]